MFKEVWGNIVHTIPLKAGLIVVVLLPAIFAGVFLGSLWDPFGAAKNLQAAVVNNDKAVDFNGTDIHIGSTMVDKLKDVDDMQFVETSADEAQEGLRSGKYAMIVTIPKDFSKNAATLLDENPKKMRLGIETNPGINYLVHNISDNASKEIRAKVTKEVNKQYAKALFEAMGDMSDGIKTARDKSGKLVTGVDKLQNGYATLQTKVGTLEDGADNLAEGTDSLRSGTDNLISGIGNLQTGYNTLDSKIGTLESGTENLQNGIDKLKTGTGNLSTGVKNLQNGVGSLKSGVSNLSSGAEKLSTGASNLVTGANNLDAGIDKLNSQVDTAVSNTSNVDTLSSGLATLKGDIDDIDTTGMTQQQIRQIQKIKGESSMLGGASSALTGMRTGLLNVQSAGSKLSSGSENLKQGAETLQENAGKISSGTKSLSSGVDKLDSGVDTLSKNTKKLVTGTDNLASGADKLETGVGKLASGVSSMGTGVTKLSQNSQKLSTGVDNLVDGSNSLTEGVGKLKDGTENMGSGISKLDTGASKLQSKLSDGADEADDNLKNVSSDTYKQAGTPVVRDTSEMTSVENFGNSMAAFLLTVGLWVGSMAFCMMYPIGQTGERKGIRAWAKDAVVFVPAAIVWGLLMLPLMNLFLAVHPANLGATLGIAALGAVAFVSIIYFINIWLGKPAMALVLVLLCLQLASCGGIFPATMSTDFYQIVHPFMPFTYTVDAFRSTIANGNSIALDIAVLSGIIAVFNALSVLILHRNGQDMPDEDAASVDVAAQLAAMGIDA